MWSSLTSSRGRGAYRVVNGVNNTAVKEEVQVVDVLEVMEVTDRSSGDRKQHVTTKTIDVITIDSDDEMDEDIQLIDSEDIQLIDSDYDTTSLTSSSVVEAIDEKPKKCWKCMTRLIGKSGQQSNEYNELTSADFYLNPRIHSSVISVELKDKTRFNCFKESIADNKESFRGKTVLIMGSCNGLLALFAAQAMARIVIVYDGTGVSELIESVIETNRTKISRNRTEFYVIRQKFDEMVLPNGIEAVDIIVSDWVNHSLFFKSTFHYFIKARDKWLRKDGLVFPDSAHMYLVGAHDYIHRHDRRDKRYSNSTFVKRIDYWTEKVYDFDMTAIKSTVLSEPFHENVKTSQVVTNECLLKTFNFYTATLDDINFTSPFDLDAIKDHYLQSFVLYFDVIFSVRRTVPRMYSTRPTAANNLFRPTLFFLDTEQQLTIYKDDRISGFFKYSINSGLNAMSVDIGFNFKNKLYDKKTEILLYRTL